MAATGPSRVDADARAGRELLAEVAGARSQTVADLAAVAMFTPACVASGRLDAGLSWLRDAGFPVVHLARVWLTPTQVDRIWLHQLAGFTTERWHVATELFCAGPAVIAVVVSPGAPEGAAARLKPLQGPSDPRAVPPGSLRWCLGPVNKLNNLVHVPDDAATTTRELPIMLGASGARAAWRAVIEGRRVLTHTPAVLAGVDGARDDGVCFVRSVSRLRWRAVLLAEGFACRDAPPAMRAALWTELEWVLHQPWAGWQTIERWRDRLGPRRGGDDFASWLGPDTVLTKVMHGLDDLIAGHPVDLAELEEGMIEAGLAPSPWETLSVKTQAVAHDLARQATQSAAGAR